MPDGIRPDSPSAYFIVVGFFAPDPKSVFCGGGRRASCIRPAQRLYEGKNADEPGFTHVGLYDFALLEDEQDPADGDTRCLCLDISANISAAPTTSPRLYAGRILLTFSTFDSAAATADEANRVNIQKSGYISAFCYRAIAAISSA